MPVTENPPITKPKPATLCWRTLVKFATETPIDGNAGACNLSHYTRERRQLKKPRSMFCSRSFLA